MAKREPVKAPVVYLRHADHVCPDCGRLGCLIPTTHDREIVTPCMVPVIAPTMAPDLRWMVGFYES